MSSSTKRTRHVYHHNAAEPYELSQDLVAKQLEVLEKKYGGSKKAKDAALTIQRAFRRYSMAKKFAHLTAQMKTEKRISRQLEAACASPSLSSRHLSNVSGNSQRHLCRHHQPVVQMTNTSCTRCHSQAVDKVDGNTNSLVVTTSLGHPVHIQVAQSSPPLTSSTKSQRFAQQHSMSIENDGGNESSSSNPNSSDIPPGGLQSFPLDESSVYSHYPHAHHHHHYHHHSHHDYQKLQHTCHLSLEGDQSPNQGAGFSHSRSHRRMTSAPHVPKRTVSRLTSTEKVEKAAKNSPKKSPNNYFMPDVDMRLASKLQYRTVAPTTSPVPVSTSATSSNPVNGDLVNYTVNEVIRKRHYRTGLNIFNKKPEKGIGYLIQRGFLENSPAAVARFLITRKGLSKQMIGEYLGNITFTFNMAVLTCFAQEMDFAGMHIDTALRKFQTYFRMPGEAQKIERLVEVFSGRYCQCNRDVTTKLHSNDTVFIMAFAIILLNTDLHTPNIKPEKRMKLEDFVRNLRSIDDGHDVDGEMLAGIYERIRNHEFRPGSDHVTQVMKVQQTIVAKCPNLAVPHRRLVCYCRLYEVADRHKKERPGLHQREVFLFNDILVITKIHSRKKNTVTYTFRTSYLLAGMAVGLFDTQFYPFGIQLSQKWDRKIVLTLNARNEHDRSKFVEDLKESIAEMDEMETLRLESELEKQRLSMASNNNNNNNNTKFHHVGNNRDSGINDSENSTSVLHGTHETDVPMRSHRNQSGAAANSVVVMRKSAINNSLLDLAENSEKMARRGSVGSLDSGMSISFQSSSVFGNNHHHRNGNPSNKDTNAR